MEFSIIVFFLNPSLSFFFFSRVPLLFSCFLMLGCESVCGADSQVQARGGKRGQGEAVGGAAAEPREGHHRALQIPAQDRVRGQSAQNCQRQDQEGRTQEQGAEGLSMEACSYPILHSSFPVQQSHNYMFDLFYMHYRTFKKLKKYKISRLICTNVMSIKYELQKSEATLALIYSLDFKMCYNFSRSPYS